MAGMERVSRPPFLRQNFAQISLTNVRYLPPMNDKRCICICICISHHFIFSIHISENYIVLRCFFCLAFESVPEYDNGSEGIDRPWKCLCITLLLPLRLLFSLFHPLAFGSPMELKLFFFFGYKMYFFIFSRFLPLSAPI